jgi:hypothetical protein
MALASFKEQWDSQYEVVLEKEMVAMKIASTRFEGDLYEGKTLKRTITNVDNLRSQNLVIGTNYSIGTISDSNEVLTVNNNRAIVFRVDSVEKIQAGKLGPAKFLGGLAARKVLRLVDGDVFAQVRVASKTFDTGDLTTTLSNGTPILLTTANVTQLLAQGEAKLGAGNVPQGHGIVVDPYVQSVFAQYLLGKNNDMSAGTFENGYVGTPTFGSDLFISNNLSADVDVTMVANPTNGQTLSLAFNGNNYTFTFVTVLGATPGNVVIGAAALNTRANLAAAINAPDVTSANFVAFTDVSPTYIASKIIEEGRLVATDVPASNRLEIRSTGSGRIQVTNGTTATVTSTLNCFFGRKGKIDVVVQDKIEAEVIKDPFQFAEIVRSRVLYGIKTFSDAAREFMWLKIQA